MAERLAHLDRIGEDRLNPAFLIGSAREDTVGEAMPYLQVKSLRRGDEWAVNTLEIAKKVIPELLVRPVLKKLRSEGVVESFAELRTENAELTEDEVCFKYVGQKLCDVIESTIIEMEAARATSPRAVFDKELVVSTFLDGIGDEFEDEFG